MTKYGKTVTRAIDNSLPMIGDKATSQGYEQLLFSNVGTKNKTLYQEKFEEKIQNFLALKIWIFENFTKMLSFQLRQKEQEK